MAEHVAIQVAQRCRRSLRQEEEEMTDYRRDELDQGLEFKILRSNSGTFRNPKTLARALQEESVAGWILLEKFDDQRIRLKRPASSRQNDAQLPADYDAYRTQFGINLTYLSLFFVPIIIGVGVLISLLTNGS